MKQSIRRDVTKERDEGEVPKLTTRGLSAYFGDAPAVKDVALEIPARRITALVGASGCGKSTFLRCLNRMHEQTAGARVRGWVHLDGQNIYDRGVDPVALRRRVGMVFERATPFPTMSIGDNLMAGHRLNGLRVADEAGLVERTLRQVGLWEEVGRRLDGPVTWLSTAQQQRLCIGRALALAPEVLLLDEPCAGLDPPSTAHVESLLVALKARCTLVVSTHNPHHAARVADFTAFFHQGTLVEVGPKERIFTNPREARTEDYVTGRFR